MVSVRNVTHQFGDKRVLEDISIDVADGEIVAIMGSSGGGKTTLLKCISGLLIPTSGEVLVDNIDVRKEPEEARRRMGMVFQSAALFDFLDVEDNVLFGVQRRSEAKKSERRSVVKEALQTVGLEGTEAKMPSELSGGMRKRVGIARAIALKPKVMLYDEPTTGLDPITTYTIDKLMESLRVTLKMTSLIVSHDVNSVVRVADRVAFLHEGKLSFLGTPKEFIEEKQDAIQELVQKAHALTLDVAY